jgi:uncharacterized protein YebE (UPF0316 family)
VVDAAGGGGRWRLRPTGGFGYTGVMEHLATALLIFILRITDVSIGTLRVLYTVRGHRPVAAALGLIESGVFIFAISRVFQAVDNPLSMLGYACGFASGTALGMTLEKWIASGHVLFRIISRTRSNEILAAMREANYGVTAIRGEGRETAVLILFAVVPRKRADALLKLIRQIDSQAFVTSEAINTAQGGYVPVGFGGAAGVKK